MLDRLKNTDLANIVTPLADDVALALSRIRMLHSAVASVKVALKGLDKQSRQDMDESKESIAEHFTTRNNLFLKTGSEADLYEARKRFCLIPVE